VINVVLVPGFTQTRHSWDAVVAWLGRDARVIDVPERETFVDTARALGDAGGDGVYAGYSMGGRLCLQLALDRPQLVAHLVLVSASPGIDDPGERVARRAADEELARAVERDGVDVFLERWLAQPLFASVPRDAAGVADRRSLSAAYVAHCLRILGTGSMEPAWTRLDELRMPVTLVTGTRDEKFTAIAEQMLTHLPEGATHVRVDAGHAVLLEAPRALAEIVADVASRH
jgi:2-succinyl-6-hydroxy-2,4-cyclohexadiene-1-carboxylate synthase